MPIKFPFISFICFIRIIEKVNECFSSSSPEYENPKGRRDEKEGGRGTKEKQEDNEGDASFLKELGERGTWPNMVKSEKH